MGRSGGAVASRPGAAAAPGGVSKALVGGKPLLPWSPAGVGEGRQSVDAPGGRRAKGKNRAG